MAVYTQISQSDVETLLSNYPIGTLKDFTAITAGIQNSNFFVNTDQGRFVLTIYENSVSEKDLPFFLNLMEHFASRNIPCPLPIKNKSGGNISHILGKPCAIVSFVKGHELKEYSIEHIAELGTNIAKMHLAGIDFPMKRPNEIGIEGWRKKFESVKARASEVSPGLAEELSKMREWLNARWPENLPSGVIHGDIFPDNVLFASDGKIAGIIDFYFACNDILAYDFAICMNAWCFDNNRNFNPEKAKALITSYTGIRPFSKDELEALPVLATGAAMRFLLTRLYSLQNQVEGAIVGTKDPLEYLHKLRFHSEVKSYEEYFLTKLKV